MVGVSAKKFALHAQNTPKSAFYGVLGELIRGRAAGEAVLGEFFRGYAAGAVVLGELFRGRAAGGAVLGEQNDEWAEGRRYLSLDILTKSRLTPQPTQQEDTPLQLSA